MLNDLSSPVFATPQAVVEYLALHQAAQEFRLEVDHRAQLEAYYQWYDQTATENRQCLARMQRELNVLGWFQRRSPQATPYKTSNSSAFR